MNAILDGQLEPVAWSPGDQSWVAQANAAWEQRFNKPIASRDCPATIYAPPGFAMWRPMVETLGWPDQPIGWDTIIALAADPEADTVKMNVERGSELSFPLAFIFPAEGLSQRVGGLLADGNTALYEAVCAATKEIARLRQADMATADPESISNVYLSISAER
jgi:hypothetical protein